MFAGLAKDTEPEAWLRSTGLSTMQAEPIEAVRPCEPQIAVPRYSPDYSALTGHGFLSPIFPAFSAGRVFLHYVPGQG